MNPETIKANFDEVRYPKILHSKSSPKKNTGATSVNISIYSHEAR